MRRRTTIAAAGAALLVALTAGPALAGYGAFAVSSTTNRYGLTSDKPTQREADDRAIEDCGGSGCKIIFRSKARQCTAIAKPDQGAKFGAASRNGRDAARLAAIEDCQKQTKAQCKIAVTKCNR